MKCGLVYVERNGNTFHCDQERHDGPWHYDSRTFQSWNINWGVHRCFAHKHIVGDPPDAREKRCERPRGHKGCHDANYKESLGMWDDPKPLLQANDFRCHKCDMPPGSVCVTADGVIRQWPHSNRVYSAAREAGLIA